MHSCLCSTTPTTVQHHIVRLPNTYKHAHTSQNDILAHSQWTLRWDICRCHHMPERGISTDTPEEWRRNLRWEIKWWEKEEESVGRTDVQYCVVLQKITHEKQQQQRAFIPPSSLFPVLCVKLKAILEVTQIRQNKTLNKKEKHVYSQH